MDDNSDPAGREKGLTPGKASGTYLIVDHVTKTFGKIRAVNDGTFSVGEGELGSHVEYGMAVGDLQLNCHCAQDLSLNPGTPVNALLTPLRCICVGG